MLRSMSTPEPTEEQLRAAYEAEIKRIRVEHVLVENIVTLINLGMRRTGLMEGTADERDPEQVRLAIEGVRAHLPLLEETAPEQAQAIRQALSQLQLAYVQLGGGPAPEPAAGEAPAPPPSPKPGAAEPPATAAPPADDPAKPGDPGPAQRSGRLWVPGQ
jgi:hypothetical protein